MSSVVSLFILVIGAFTLEVWFTLERLVTQQVFITIEHNTLYILMYSPMVLYICANVITDALFIHRCYLVYNRNKRILLFQSILSILNTVWAIIAAVLMLTKRTGLWQAGTIELDIVFPWVNFITNTVLTGMIAGRIWYLQQCLGKYLGPKVRRKYQEIFAIVLESGLVYSFTLLTFPVIKLIIPAIPPFVFLTQFAVLFQGIVPTYTIVRSARRRDMEESDPEISPNVIHITQPPVDG